MYVRTKRIVSKNSACTYAYLVKNKRLKHRIKQKNIRYLGRVYKLSPIASNSLDSTHLDKDKHSIIYSLVEVELFNHGFKKTNQYNFQLEDIKITLDKTKIKNAKNKDVVLEINEGFLCEHTIKALLAFKFPNLDEKSCGICLASALLNAGIKLSPELFIKIFNKFYEDIFPSISN